MSHIPVRNCAACRVRLPKSKLIRIVRTPDGEVHYDPTGKSDGRGLYWCGDDACLKKMRKKQLVNRLLKANTPESIYNKLEEVLKG